MLLELNSPDIVNALAYELKSIFDGATVYSGLMPVSGVIFPHYQIQHYQTSRRQASRLQIRDEYDIHICYITIKYRRFAGTGLVPANLLAQLNNIGYIMLSNLRTIQLGNYMHRLHETRYDIEPEDGVGLRVGGFYCTIEVPVLRHHERAPLQKKLRYEIHTKNGSVIVKDAPTPTKRRNLYEY